MNYIECSVKHVGSNSVIMGLKVDYKHCERTNLVTFNGVKLSPNKSGVL